jgi:hypothetical protein
MTKLNVLKQMPFDDFMVGVLSIESSELANLIDSEREELEILELLENLQTLGEGLSVESILDAGACGLRETKEAEKIARKIVEVLSDTNEVMTVFYQKPES